MREKKTVNYTKNKLLTKVFDFYIFSNIHVAFATFSLVKITLLNIGILKNTSAWFVFFSTLLSYNIIRLLRLDSIKNWYNIWIKNNIKPLYFINSLSLISIIYLSFYLHLKSVIVLFPFVLATLFYTFPLKKYSLRNIANLKLFLIAFSWAGITVLFPLSQNYITPRTIDYFVFLQRFLFIIVITIPFDIRDLDYDSKKLRTLPQQIGIKKTKIFGLALLLIFNIIEFLKPTTEQALFSTCLITLISAVFLIYSNQKQSKYYSAFFIESIPIIWFLLICL